MSGSVCGGGTTRWKGENPVTRQALEDFYEATGGPDWDSSEAVGAMLKVHELVPIMSP